jgi:hypothetical protein
MIITACGTTPLPLVVIVEGRGTQRGDTQSDCPLQVLERYLVDGLLPVFGMTCAPGIVPFAPAT